ncbi:MAG: pilus assembly protein N-terminal domain-containing protein [Hyphomicrobium sp.]|nr:pilus assembly protein N-terminal domain-containing protein [Hyphomicrobium sp.]
MFSVSPSSRWAIVAAMSVFGITASVFRVEAADLLVRYDQSQLIRLPRPVSEIIIGNPSIADVNVQGGNLLVVTGKTFGVTNIIALDADKNVIQDQRVIVEQDDRRTVVVYRGALRHSYTCAPTCTPAPVVGDAQQFFEETLKAAQTKAGASVPGTDAQPSE